MWGYLIYNGFINQKYIYSKEGKMLVIILPIILFIYFFDKISFQDFIPNSFYNISGLLIIAFWIYTAIINSKIYQPIHKEYFGQVIINYHSIIVNETEYNIDHIKEINIDNIDYKGKLLKYNGLALGPVLSNGTENYISIIFKDGSSFYLNYYQEEQGQISLQDDVIKKYNTLGILSVV